MNSALAARLSIPAHIQVLHVPGDGVFLVSQRGADVFSGGVFESLVPLLNGSRSLEEIADGLKDKHPLTEIFYAVQLLQKAGYVADLSDASREEDRYRLLYGASWREFAATVSNHSSADASALLELLGHQGLLGPRGGDMEIVLADDYLEPGLAQANEIALATGRPWMIARPAGPVLWIGPVFEPGRTGCWECLAERLRSNRPVEKYLEQKTGNRMVAPAVPNRAIESLCASLIVNELCRWATVGNPAELLAFDVVSGSAERHRVVRLPQCRVCGGNLADSADAMLARGDDAALVNRDGGLRVETATDTFKRLGHHVSAVTGVVNNLRKLDTGDDRIHVYVAGHNRAATRGSLAVLGRSLRSLNSGKGISDAQAKTSALCEGIERYASVFQGNEPHRIASSADLGGAAIHPRDCMLFSDAQYNDRETWNRRGDHFSWVPRRLEDDERLWWSEVWNVSTRAKRYLPTAHVYFHSDNLADPVGSEVCAVDSNGHAAGRTYGDAILQGLFELVERDAVACWWYPRGRVPGVDLHNFRSEYFEACVEYHGSRGRELWVLDVTADLAIPTFVAVSRRHSDHGRIGLGFGAHLDAKTAIGRAIGELNQFLGGVENWTPPTPGFNDGTSKWIGSATTDSEPYLLPATDCAVTDAGTYPGHPLDIEGALARSLERVHAAGLEAFVADLTRPDIDLKVVKVVVPGLRHFWARFAPGRLYSVPVALGRLAEPVPEAALNGTPMFL